MGAAGWYLKWERLGGILKGSGWVVVKMGAAGWYFKWERLGGI
jgi:hypothetical protein